MKKIKVSVVIPVYNASKYLKQCIDSVIKQNYSNIEIILIDDGSIDGSGKICDDYAKNDNRVKVYHQKNSGVSNARNNGLMMSTGDYVCFVDSDDIIHQEYIQKLVKNGSNDVLAVCQIENFCKDVLSIEKNDIEDTILEKNQFVKLCKINLLNTPCCKLYDLSIIRKNKILFDEKLSLGEDLLFNLDYLKYVKKIVVTNQKLYYYRRDENNTLSTTYNPKMFDIQILLFDKYTEYFKNIAMNDVELCIFDSYRLSTLKIIIENEFKNKNISFWQRFSNTRKIIGEKRFKSRIESIHYEEEKLMCFLIRNRLLLTYKIVNKIKNLI